MDAIRSMSQLKIRQSNRDGREDDYENQAEYQCSHYIKNIRECLIYLDTQNPAGSEQTDRQGRVVPPIARLSIRMTPK